MSRSDSKTNVTTTVAWILLSMFCLFSLWDTYSKAQNPPKPLSVNMDVIVDMMLICNDHHGLSSIDIPHDLDKKEITITAVCKSGLKAYRVIPTTE